ncbi:MAG: hypothetical protein WCV90_08190 [Candidatus Woesearchaeota archaeon]|jgi:hypothetical protein
MVRTASGVVKSVLTHGSDNYMVVVEIVGGGTLSIDCDMEAYSKLVGIRKGTKIEILLS